MKNGIKRLLIFIIIILVIVIATTLYYKFSKNEEYIILDIKNEYKKINVDLSKYEDKVNIVYKNPTIENYSDDINVFNDDEDFNGKIIIEDSHLYLKDEYTHKKKEMIDNVLHMLYVMPDNSKYINVYVLTKDHDLYAFNIDGRPLDEIETTKINKNIKIKDFTDFKINSYLNEEVMDFVVLGEDNKLYYMPSEILYDPDMINVLDTYIVYSDSSISIMDGRVLKDKIGKEIKIKNIIIPISEDNPLKDKPGIIFIDTNNNLVYSIDNKVCIYNKKISNIKTEGSNVKIEFEDNSSIKFKYIEDERYYSINK